MEKHFIQGNYVITLTPENEIKRVLNLQNIEDPVLLIDLSREDLSKICKAITLYEMGYIQDFVLSEELKKKEMEKKEGRI